MIYFLSLYKLLHTSLQNIFMSLLYVHYDNLSESFVKYFLYLLLFIFMEVREIDKLNDFIIRV